LFGDGLLLLNSLRCRLLLGRFSTSSSLHISGFLGQNELDVRRRRHVWVNATVSTICPSSHLGGLLDLDVRNIEFADIQLLDLSICFRILKQAQHVFNALLGPTCLGHTSLLVVGIGLRSATNTPTKSSEGNGSLMLQDVIQIFDRDIVLKSTKGEGGFSGVLEMNTNVRSSRLGRFIRIVGFSGVF